MSQLIPGIQLHRVSSGRRAAFQEECLQFRSPITGSGGACLAPVVMVDGVRQTNATIALRGLLTSDIRRVEVLPPGEAGVQYGTDSQYGVVLIETLSGEARASTTRPDMRAGASTTGASSPSPTPGSGR